MGIYVNPGNQAFKEISGPNYVDKTGLIDMINESINSSGKLICISRPRRFGKSYAAKMLTAYYDCSCDSDALFAGRQISESENYRKHLNQYNVICLDITAFLSEAQRVGDSPRVVPGRIVSALRRELDSIAPDLPPGTDLETAMIHCVEKQNGRKFIFIIDEWDALIREAKDDEEAQKRYLNLLRSWFKNSNFTSRAVAAAYMTGILPIKKDGSQSAISDFEEYSMIEPYTFGKYVGFTEDEVREKCREAGVDFAAMKHWYDGYRFPDVGSVYNPNSVMKAVRLKRFRSYWTETSAAEGLMDYISKGYTGLSKNIAELIGGVDVPVNPIGFANDLTTFRGKDDVLTLMIHLGYLAYDAEKGTARIPNEEIRQEFQRSVRDVHHQETLLRLQESDKLFDDTIHENAEAVAARIEKIHLEEADPRFYNNEQALRSVIKLAYYTYRDHYMQMEELPAGRGYADIVYLPKPDSWYPALIIELKWDQSSDGAIRQIREKHYPSCLKDYSGDFLLVGISYSQKTGHHTCTIEKGSLPCLD